MNEQAPLYLGLIHYPIRNKRDEVVATSVTNMDIHDISRSCRTFGVNTYFIVTPMQAQHRVVGQILGHWEAEKQFAYNPDRQEALKKTFLIESFEDAYKAIEEKEGEAPLVVATGANFQGPDFTVQQMRDQRKIDKRPLFLLFGTGWGLHARILERAHHFLEPIAGASEDGYNHLSVRSAVAIYLDKLCSGL